MEFRVINYVGILFSKDGVWHLSDEQKGDVNLTKELQVMSGGQVQLVAQHAPPDPPDPSRWGGGCCMWEATEQKCPSGHHDRPGYLYSVSGIGEIRYAKAGGDNPWCLKRDRRLPLPIYFGMLDGHRCRFMIVPQVKEEPKEESNDLQSLEKLIERATQLRDFIEAANKAGSK